MRRPRMEHLELAKGLAVRGHHVEFLKIETGAPAGITESHYESVPVTTLRMNTPQLPVIRNLAKNEWLWRDLASYLSDVRLARDRFDVLHAQDVTTAVPVIRAATACGIPAVVTVGIIGRSATGRIWSTTLVSLICAPHARPT